MKKILLCMFLGVFALSAFAAKPQAKVSVTLKRGAPMKSVTLFKVANGHLSQIETLTPAEGDSVVKFAFSPEYTGFYAVGDAKDHDFAYPLYLKPGNKANIDIYMDYAALSGKNTRENQALYQWEEVSYQSRLYGSAVTFGRFPRYFKDGHTFVQVYPEFGKLINGMDSLQRAIPASMNKGKNFKATRNLDKDFKTLLKRKMKYDLDYYIMRFSGSPNSAFPKYEDYPSYFHTIISPEEFGDESILKMPNGFYTMRYAGTFNFLMTPADKRVQGATAPSNLIANEKVRRAFEVEQAAQSQPRTYEQYQDLIARFGNEMDEDQLARLNARGEALKATAAGTPAIDFNGVDLDGKRHNLSDYKGKVVYIDVWATWCGPCLAEIPSLKELEAEYHNNSNIIFMSVSVDRPADVQKWRDMVKEKDLQGLQIYTGSSGSINRDYQINSIPRFIVIAKDGTLASNDAPRPSSGKTIRDLLNTELAK